jgi:hypothetical protein
MFPTMQVRIVATRNQVESSPDPMT